MIILRDISQIVADLLKYQFEQFGNVYKKILIKIRGWVLAILTAIMLAIGGLGLFLVGAHIQLSVYVGPAGASYILGAFLILLAIIIFLFGKSLLKD